MHRRVASLALAVAGIGLLSACEKPAPAVTFFSGTDSTRVEADCYSEDNAQARCEIPTSGTDSLKIRPGETVGISVDPQIAENGWVPAVGNRGLLSQAVEEPYYRFTMTEEQIAQGSLQVFATYGDSGYRGVWVIDVERG
jgi:hypothetical protein